MSDEEYDPKRELKLHDPFVLPDELELEHEIERPRWWYAQQLRLAGASWPEVARALGYSDAGYARRIVAQNSDFKLENAAEMIRMELERLDMLQLVVWRKARAGSIKDIETVLKIMQMRAKYLGLDDGKHGDEESDGKTGVIVIGGDTEEYIEALRQVTTVKERARTPEHKAPIEGDVAS